MDEQHYLEIVNKYGAYASWAIWRDVGIKPKSNVGDLTVFNHTTNKELLGLLKPNVVMVGLNISRKIESTFGNFHDSRPHSQDYKIRYAFRGTKFYGAYMTDIIKDFEQKMSGAVSKYLKTNRDFERQNILSFEQEMDDLRSKDPTIIAFGNDSFDILDRHFRKTLRIVKVPHYSNHINKVDYRAEIEKITSHL
jgi:hypothetical protein